MEDIANAIHECFTSEGTPVLNLTGANIVDVLACIADAISSAADQIGKEGIEGMGAIESLCVSIAGVGNGAPLSEAIQHGCDSIGGSIDYLARSMDRVGAALERMNR